MVDFGIHLAEPAAEKMGDRHAHYRDLLTRGKGAFSSAWVSDHLMKDDEPSLTLGNLVLSQGYRNPALLAKMAATLQYLTDGRLILGIGAGWPAFH